MSIAVKSYIRSIAHVGSVIWMRGWAEANAGNVSIDVTQAAGHGSFNTSHFPEIAYPGHYPECAGRTYLVTTAGSRFRELAEAPWRNILLIRISSTGNAYCILQGGIDNNSRATSELAIHLGVHASIQKHDRKETAVLHTHPTHLIAVTNLADYSNGKTLHQLLFSIHPEVPMYLPEGIGFVPYCSPGSDKLATHTVAALETGVRIVVMEKHGSLAVAESIERAFDLTDVASKAAEIFLLSKSSGYDVQGLSEQQVIELKRLHHNEK